MRNRNKEMSIVFSGVITNTNKAYIEASKEAIKAYRKHCIGVDDEPSDHVQVFDLGDNKRLLRFICTRNVIENHILSQGLKDVEVISFHSGVEDESSMNPYIREVLDRMKRGDLGERKEIDIRNIDTEAGTE